MVTKVKISPNLSIHTYQIGADLHSAATQLSIHTYLDLSDLWQHGPSA
jgi:hypothetical protein